jgi:hypothetical protein
VRSYNVQKVLFDGHMGPPSVDRTTLLNEMSSAFGATTWIDCESTTKLLMNAVICLSPVYPYGITDCPFSPTQSGGSGIPCQGQLSMPSGVEVGHRAGGAASCAPSWQLRSWPLRQQPFTLGLTRSFHCRAGDPSMQ